MAHSVLFGHLGSPVSGTGSEVEDYAECSPCTSSPDAASPLPSPPIEEDEGSADPTEVAVEKPGEREVNGAVGDGLEHVQNPPNRTSV